MSIDPGTVSARRKFTIRSWKNETGEPSCGLRFTLIPGGDSAVPLDGWTL